MKAVFFSVLLCFAALSAFAEVRVAFIEMKDVEGGRVELEPNGRFGHVAVSYRDRWLHILAPGRVELISWEKLKAIGEVSVILDLPNASEITESQMLRFLNKKYDFGYSWSDGEIYSSELVGKLLGIEPKPMKFDAKMWHGLAVPKSGELGLSPDDIYNELASRWSRRFPNCAKEK